MFLLRLTKLINILLEPMFVSALLKGSAASTEHKKVLQHLNCKYVVDVGANRGQFALITRRLFPSAAIHSFEPLDEPAKIFNNVFAKDSQVKLYPFAIGSEIATSIIHVSQEDDSSSLLPITSAQTQLFPGAMERESRSVQVFPLSQVLDPECISPESAQK